jgi:hypothetical protein
VGQNASRSNVVAIMFHRPLALLRGFSCFGEYCKTFGSLGFSFCGSSWFFGSIDFLHVFFFLDFLSFLFLSFFSIYFY